MTKRIGGKPARIGRVRPGKTGLPGRIIAAPTCPLGFTEAGTSPLAKREPPPTPRRKTPRSACAIPSGAEAGRSGDPPPPAPIPLAPTVALPQVQIQVAAPPLIRPYPAVDEFANLPQALLSSHALICYGLQLRFSNFSTRSHTAARRAAKPALGAALSSSGTPARPGIVRSTRRRSASARGTPCCGRCRPFAPPPLGSCRGPAAP